MVKKEEPNNNKLKKEDQRSEKIIRKREKLDEKQDTVVQELEEMGVSKEDYEGLDEVQKEGLLQGLKVDEEKKLFDKETKERLTPGVKKEAVPSEKQELEKTEEQAGEAKGKAKDSIEEVTKPEDSSDEDGQAQEQTPIPEKKEQELVDVSEKTKELLSKELGYVDIEPKTIFESLSKEDMEELQVLMKGGKEVVNLEDELIKIRKELQDFQDTHIFLNKEENKKKKQRMKELKKEIKDKDRKLKELKDKGNTSEIIDFYKNKISEIAVSQGREKQLTEEKIQEIAKNLQETIQQTIDAQAQQVVSKFGLKKFGKMAGGILKNMGLMVGAGYLIAGGLGIATGGAGIVVMAGGMALTRLIQRKISGKRKEKKAVETEEKLKQQLQQERDNALEELFKDKEKFKEKLSGAISNEMRRQTSGEAVKKLLKDYKDAKVEGNTEVIESNLDKLEKEYYLSALAIIEAKIVSGSLKVENEDQKHNMAVQMAMTLAQHERGENEAARRLEDLEKNKPEIYRFVQKFNLLRGGVPDKKPKGMTNEEETFWDKYKYDLASIGIGTAVGVAIRTSGWARIAAGVVGGIGTGYMIGEFLGKRGERKALKEIENMVDKAEEVIRDIEFPADELPDLRKDATLVQSRLELGLLKTNPLLKTRAENFIHNIRQVEFANQKVLNELLKQQEDNNKKLEEQVEKDVTAIEKKTKRRRVLSMIGGAIGGGLTAGAFTEQGKEIIGQGKEMIFGSGEGEVELETGEPSDEVIDEQIQALKQQGQEIKDEVLPGGAPKISSEPPAVEHLEYQGGKGAWAEMKNQLQQRGSFKELFTGGDEAEQTHAIDYFKDKIVADPEAYGLETGEGFDIDKLSPEQLKDIDWDKLLSIDESVIDKAFPELVEEAKQNIIENNDLLREYVSKTGESLDTDTVDHVLEDIKEAGGVEEYLKSEKIAEPEELAKPEEVVEPKPEEVVKPEELLLEEEDMELLDQQAAEIEALSRNETLARELESLHPDAEQNWLDQFNVDNKGIITREEYEGTYILKDNGDLIYSGGKGPSGAEIGPHILKADADIRDWRDYAPTTDEQELLDQKLIIEEVTPPTEEAVPLAAEEVPPPVEEKVITPPMEDKKVIPPAEEEEVPPVEKVTPEEKVTAPERVETNPAVEKINTALENYKENHPNAVVSPLESSSVEEYTYHTCKIDGNTAYFDDSGGMIKDNFKIGFIENGMNPEGDTATKIFDTIGDRSDKSGLEFKDIGDKKYVVYDSNPSNPFGHPKQYFYPDGKEITNDVHKFTLEQGLDPQDKGDITKAYETFKEVHPEVTQSISERLHDQALQFVEGNKMFGKSDENILKRMTSMFTEDFKGDTDKAREFAKQIIEEYNSK